MQAEGEADRLSVVQESPPDFRTFFEDEHRGLLKALHFVTGDRAEAADLMQEAFVKVWELWGRIDTIKDPRAYLFRVAFNGSKMRARSAALAAKHAVPFVAVRDAYDDIDLREDVRRMLQSLTPRQRTALVLVDLYGYGSEDAAEIMGVRPSTVRALATQGRAALRATGGSSDG
jgi:RNA polymerase sigma-70 factor (ECF subfamily)